MSIEKTHTLVYNMSLILQTSQDAQLQLNISMPDGCVVEESSLYQNKMT